jgi:hypothetical protein
VTIIIPSTCLPSAPPKDGRAKLWGGGLPIITDPFSIPFAPRLRRIYTDDSDIVLAALHSGRISWSGMQHARREGLDLKLVLLLVRDRDVGRYMGGQGASVEVLPGEVKEREGVDLGLEGLLREAAVAGRKKGRKEGKGRDVGGAGSSGVEGDSVVLSWLTSASWGNGHDGSGMEVVCAEWLPVSLPFLLVSSVC